MSKLALCFSGHSRTFEKCFDSINKQIITKYECDIFISTYFVSDELSNKIIDLYKPKKITFINEDVEFTTKIHKYINSLPLCNVLIIPVYNIDSNALSYKENKYFDTNIINQYNITTNNIKKEKLFYGAVCQFFGIYDVANICLKYINEHNINYDYIIRLRLDDIIDNNFTIIPLDENEILINMIQNYSNSLKAQDHYFMAKPNTFFKISNLYIDLPDIIEYVNNNNNYWIPSSGYQETFLFMNIIRQNIGIKESTNLFNIYKLCSI